MAIRLENKMKGLTSEGRRKIEARAAEILKEHMTLQELRRARKLTQVHVARELGISQDSVSRLEKRSDILLSTLKKTVAAMGGSLSIVAEFPNSKPVFLNCISEITSDIKQKVHR